MLLAGAEVLSAAEAGAAVRAASVNARPLLVRDRGRRRPEWLGDDVEVVAPAELAAKRTGVVDAGGVVVVVDVGALTTIVDVLRCLAIDRLPDELALLFDDSASPASAAGVAETDEFVADERPVVWVPILHDAEVQALRRLFERVNPVTTLPVVPWPAADPRRADDLIVACAPLLDAAGAGSGEIVYASDSTPLDLYRSLGALHEQLEATYASPDSARLVLTPHARDAHGLATALAAYEYGAELVLLPRPHAAEPRASRILWASRMARATALG